MNFSSAIFIYVFLPVFLVSYLFVEWIQDKVKLLKRIRVLDFWVLIFSFIFYAWACFDNVLYLLLMVLLLYFCGFLIEKYRNSKRAFIISSAMIIFCMLVLYVYKYACGINIAEMIKYIPIVTPLGISFLFFSMISYIIDVYRGKEAGNILDVVNYICFFPKVISGPIITWNKWNAYYHDRNSRALDERLAGFCERFIIGLSKKVVLADSLGNLISVIGNGDMDVITSWLITFMYTFQIYFDFSGYSDIAIGLAQFMGFDVAENFDFPYVSTSISEFWRRWHISLGSWFKEYIYIPLGGNRRGKIRTYVNLFLVMFISGIWHGAGLGYIVWGSIHGLCNVFERFCSDMKLYKRVPLIVKWFVTFMIVSLCWEFFRTNSMYETILHFGKMLGIGNGNPVFTYRYFVNRKLVFILGLSFVFSVPFKFLLDHLKKCCFVTKNVWMIIKRVVLIGALALDLVLITNSTYSPFIYFQY